SGASSAETAFPCTAGRHGESASAAGVRYSNFGSRFAGDDNPGAGSVASSVARRSYGRTQVERTAGTSAFVSSSAARESFAAAQARRRWHDVGIAQNRASGRTGAAAFLRTAVLGTGAFDAGRRW